MAAVVLIGVLSASLTNQSKPDPVPWRRCRDELTALSNAPAPEHHPVVFGNGTKKAARTLKRSAACGTRRNSFPAGQTTRATISVRDPGFSGNSVTRNYRVYVPRNYDGDSAPVMLHFHGFCGSDSSQSGLERIGEENGAITVWLRGQGDGSCNSWNNLNAGSGGDESCTNRAQAECYTSCNRLNQCGKCNCYTCADDAAFVRGVLDTLSAELCIDLGRIYAAGYSNGGGETFILPQLLPDTFAAVVSILGQPFLGAYDIDSKTKGTALLHFGGTRDNIIPIDGSTSTCGFVYVSQSQATRAFADVNDCGDRTSTYNTPYDGRSSMSCESYRSCQAAEVVSCVANTGHGYPSFAFDLIWWFVLQHSR